MADSGHPIIVFLSKNNETTNETFLNDKLVPTNSSFPLSVMNLDKPGKYVIDTNFKVLKKREEIIANSKKTLDLMESYSRKNSSAKIESRILEIPPDSEAFTSLYSGSSCYLIVPNFMFSEAKKSIFN